MSIRLVRLGEARTPDEGLRIGTVRRPPRGVRRADFASKDWYDVWFPNLAPSAPLVDAARRAQTPAEWAAFVRRYRAEMGAPGPRHDLALLAALSRHTNFAVGCYCERAERCHRSVLRELLAEHGAQFD
jgi:uncharacterized protein YeaO (DUF488 family)